MPSQLAAIDLGSNSFHMIVARLDGDRLKILDRMRERVRLGAGLDENGRITAEAQDRAIECIERFGQRVRELQVGRVRAVGTNALRRAKNGKRFLNKAGKALGHPIEIIAGREEARLIYLGVIQSLSLDTNRRFVVDIGGGSTECIVGDGAEILEADSLFMGCVSYSNTFFPNGKITADNFERAEVAAKAELHPLSGTYRKHNWDAAIGCSGTIHAVQRILKANEWSKGNISRKSVKQLKRAMIDAGRIEDLEIPGLLADRKPVIAGGVAILRAVFSAMKIEELTPSPGALREGTLYDLIGRIHHEDVREKTVQWFCEHYKIDISHAERVHKVAESLYNQVREAWEFDDAQSRNLLRWACYLHETGNTISHTGFHKHSAYIVENADMAGFSRNAQRMLAAIISSHRRKCHLNHFESLSENDAIDAERLCVLLRIATTLQRSRSDQAPSNLEARIKKDQLILKFDREWLDTHPMTSGDLNKDAQYIKVIGVELKIRANA